MLNNFYLETCMVEGRVLEGYPGLTRKAFSTFQKAKLECSKGTLSTFMLYEDSIILVFLINIVRTVASNSDC